MSVRVAAYGDELVITGPVAPGVAKAVGARWDARRDAFVAPAARHVAAIIEDVLGVPALALVDGLDPVPVPSSDERLRPWQRDASGWLASRERGGVLVLSPGLGKTPVSIVAADEVAPRGGGVLVVCPSSLVPNWWREIEAWGRALHADWSVETWDRAARLAAFDGGRAFGTWDVVILDESVMAKSRRSKRFKSLARVRRQMGRVFLLSGNPTTRHSDDLWTQLSLVWPKAFRSFWRFAERYCVIEETPWARVVVGDRHDRDVMAENRDLVYVVNQEDVEDLPEYLFEVVDVDLAPSQRKAYEDMRDDFVASLNGEEIVAENEAARLTHLLMIASWFPGASGKHDALVELVESGAYEYPMIVWTHWRDGARALTERLTRALPDLAVVHVDGTTPKRERDRELQALKDGRVEVLVLSIGVGKFGHTFTNAKTMVYVDKTWAADDYFQSLRRIRRIGLKHRPVVVTIRAPGTVDELVEANLEGKVENIARVTKSRLRELLMGLGKD